MTSYEAFEKDCLMSDDPVIRCRRCSGTNIREMMDFDQITGYSDLIPWCRTCDGRAD